MPAFGPVSRKNLIKALKQAGFEGPFSGGKHQFMIRQNTRLTLPNPHQGDVGVDLLNRILKQAGITRQEWEGLD